MTVLPLASMVIITSQLTGCAAMLAMPLPNGNSVGLVRTTTSKDFARNGEPVAPFSDHWSLEIFRGLPKNPPPASP